MITTKDRQEHKQPAATPQSAYIHIPFCKHKCEFCDFAAFAGLDHLEDEYTAVLCQEIAGRLTSAREASGERPVLKTVFFGGGTPGLLGLDNLRKIFSTLDEHVDYAEDVEISLETTPHAISAAKIDGWRQLGITRISIGVESLSDAELSAIGRDHTVAEAMSGIELAVTHASGPVDSVGSDAKKKITDISLDFMYGLPTQTLSSFGETLNRAVELSLKWPIIGHISAYCLELAVNSPLKSRFPDGDPRYPKDETQVQMYHALVAKVAEAGFTQYEVSNFARPGKESRHNMTYWQNKPYFAFGVGAHRYVGGVRSSNTRSFKKYLREPFIDDQHEVIDQKIAAKEGLMLGLRMLRGLDLEGFAAEHGIDLLTMRKKEIEAMQKEGLIRLSDGRLALTQSGVPISNSIIATLI
jgi:oxygen-independent coproporphyrinogen-3 oxidase